MSSTEKKRGMGVNGQRTDDRTNDPKTQASYRVLLAAKINKQARKYETNYARAAY